MLAVAGQRLGERVSGGFCLLRLFSVYNGNEKVLELRKKFLERLGALPPRQAGCEHFIRVGRDAEMTSRVPSGKKYQEKASENYGESVAPAKIDQADEQSRKCHQDPRRCRMRRSMDDRLGLYRKIGLPRQPFPFAWGGRWFAGSQKDYCKIPPDSSAVFCRRLTSNPAPPPSARSERISDRCEATRLIAPSASTSTTFHPPLSWRMT